MEQQGSYEATKSKNVERMAPICFVLFDNIWAKEGITK